MITYAMCPAYLQRYLSATMLASSDDIKLAHDMFSEQPLADVLLFNDAGDEATIVITGPLTMNGPDFLARLFGFGGTGYNDIITAANLLRNNKSVKKVTLRVLSPGGEQVGVGEAYQALVDLAAVIPMEAENHGQMSSAAYLLAMAAHTIKAMSPLAMTGSLGVVAGGFDTSEALKREGVRRIKIVSSNAPNKQADPATDHGLIVIKEEIDAVERIFFDIVATGRNTTVEDVIENFGKGAELVARDPDESKPDALSVGMIDSVMGNAIENVAVQNDGINETADDGDDEGNIMDLNQLKAEHPAIFAAAVSEGVVSGVKMERSRVSSHVALGEASGDMKLALKNINEGTEHDGASNAMYTAAQLNNQSVASRDADNVGALNTDNADNGDTELTAALADKLGVTI